MHRRRWREAHIGARHRSERQCLTIGESDRAAQSGPSGAALVAEAHALGLTEAGFIQDARSDAPLLRTEPHVGRREVLGVTNEQQRH